MILLRLALSTAVLNRFLCSAHPRESGDEQGGSVGR